jgi:hypothetical protein
MAAGETGLQRQTGSDPAPGGRVGIGPLAHAALAGVGGFVVAMLALHWLQPGLGVRDEAISYAVHGTYGWLVTVGLLALGLGSLALTVGIARSGPRRGTAAGRWCLAVWTAGVLLGAIFPVDPPGNWSKPPSPAGQIHGMVSLVAFVALPLAGLLLAPGLRRDRRWRPLSTWLLGLALAATLALSAFLAALAPAIISPGPPVLLGLAERMLLVADTAWLAAVGIGLRRVSSRR